MKKTVDSNGNSTTYIYDHSGNIKTVTNASGDVRSYEYNESRKVTKIAEFDGTSLYSFSCRQGSGCSEYGFIRDDLCSIVVGFYFMRATIVKKKIFVEDQELKVKSAWRKQRNINIGDIGHAKIIQKTATPSLFVE